MTGVQTCALPIFRYLPGELTTIAVLTNQSRTDPAIIVEHLLKIALAPEPACVGCIPTP